MTNNITYLILIYLCDYTINEYKKTYKESIEKNFNYRNIWKYNLWPYKESFISLLHSIKIGTIYILPRSFAFNEIK